MAIFQIYLASLTSVKKREKQPKKIIVKTWNFRVKLLSNSYCRYKNTLNPFSLTSKKLAFSNINTIVISYLIPDSIFNILQY